jgi:CHAD domain-containing protein
MAVGRVTGWRSLAATKVATMSSPTRELFWVEAGPVGLESIVEALSAQFTVGTGALQLVRRVRLDTFDRRLDAAGLMLEHQILASGKWLVLGRLDGSSMVRAPVTDLRWPAFADTLPEGAVRDTVAPVSGIRALMVISDERRRMHRLELRNGQGKTVARVELDEPASRIYTVPTEVWLLTLRGYEAQARRAALLLSGTGLFAVGDVPGYPPSYLPPALTGDSPATALLSTVLHDFMMAMGKNLPGLLDDVDSEFLHDFRVAVRRTRSTLKLGRPALPEVMRTRWEPAFKWLGDLTTPVRDLDVYELDLPTMASWLVATDPSDLGPFARHLRSRRTAERLKLVRGLRSARFRRLMADWAEELARLGADPDDADLSAGGLADRSISRAYQRVLRGGEAISGDSPATDLHDLRKRCKELRYALEVFAPVIDDATGRRAVNDLRGLQDVLGRFQDTEVQRHALRGFAEEMMADGTPAAAVLVMGELIGHLDAEQDRARNEFDVAFARFTRRSSQQLMHRLGGGQ